FPASGNVGMYSVPNPTTNPAPYVLFNPLDQIRMKLSDGTGSGISTMSVTWSLGYNDSINEVFQWTGAGGWVQSAVPTSFVAGSTVVLTPGALNEWYVAVASGIDWSHSSEFYHFRATATDVAGNRSFFGWDFIFDSTAPTISQVSITSGTSFSNPNLLPSAVAGLVQDAINNSFNFDAGVQNVGIGIMRIDKFGINWYHAGNWVASRNPPVGG